MIKVTIKIPTIADFWLWCIKKASKNDKENWKRVYNVEDRIKWHINREPIPEENKQYLREAVYDEFRKLSLKRCIWPVKIKK